MEKDKAIAIFTQLTSTEYDVPGDPEEGEEEPFISGFKEPTYGAALHAELGGKTPVERRWAVEVRFSGSPFRPESNDALRLLLDLSDEADVGLVFLDSGLIRLS